MPLKRTLLWLCVIGLTVGMAIPVAAQDLQGMQLFAPAELSDYGDGPQPKEGFFFVFDGMWWSIGRPDKTPIGNAAEASRIVYNVGDDELGWTQTNTHDTGQLTSGRTNSGNRFELGRVTEDGGWFLGVYNLKSQSQEFTASDVGIVFADDDSWAVPIGGRLEGPVTSTTVDDEVIFGPSVALPVIFDHLSVENRVKHWSVELMGLKRSHQLHRGGFFEWFAGVRYMEFDDMFNVLGQRENTGTDGVPTDADLARVILADSHWNTDAQNHIVGPQLGARVFKQFGRCTLSGEGKFLAGYNSQNIHQTGVLGTELPNPGGDRVLGQPELMTPTDFEHAAYLHEWSPAVEVRLDLKYQVTRSISVRAGWTGVWIDGVARAADMVDYSLTKDSVMGILSEHNRTNVLAHGVTVGVDINR